MQPLLEIGGNRDEWRGVYIYFVLFGRISGLYVERSDVHVHNLVALLPELNL